MCNIPHCPECRKATANRATERLVFAVVVAGSFDRVCALGSRDRKTDTERCHFDRVCRALGSRDSETTMFDTFSLWGHATVKQQCLIMFALLGHVEQAFMHTETGGCPQS